MSPPEGDHDDTWNEYRRLVLAELERLSKAVGDIDKRVTEAVGGIDKRVTELQIKVGVWAALGGLLGGLVVAVVAAYIQAQM